MELARGPGRFVVGQAGPRLPAITAQKVLNLGASQFAFVSDFVLRISPVHLAANMATSLRRHLTGEEQLSVARFLSRGQAGVHQEFAFLIGLVIGVDVPQIVVAAVQ